MRIYLEGNIGTGKTTFLTFLKTLFPSASFIYEPVGEWLNLKGKDGRNILEHFYEDINKWSFPFQMNSFITRVKSIEDAPDNSLMFIERSVYTDQKCFAKNCYDSGKMTKIEYDIYMRWHAWLLDKFKFNDRAEAFIYLRTSPDISLERIQKRERGGESKISIDYLNTLHELHEDWLGQNPGEDSNILILDISKNIYEDEKEKQKIIEQLSDFLKMLSEKGFIL